MRINKSRIFKGAIAAGVAASLGLSASPAIAGEIGPSSSVSSQSNATSASSPTGKFTSADWREVQRNAQKAGDKGAAQAAGEMADRSDPNKVGTRNIITTAAKKALVAALRYGESKLPAKIRPYAGKIANVIEDVENFQEGALTNALMAAGIPLDVAQAAAKWAVVFGGL